MPNVPPQIPTKRLLNVNLLKQKNILKPKRAKAEGSSTGNSSVDNKHLSFSNFPVLLSVLGMGLCSLLLTGLLTACGQSGALYLPEEAPSNTDFILYKKNKAQDENRSYTSEDVKEAAAEDPEDY